MAKQFFALSILLLGISGCASYKQVKEMDVAATEIIKHSDPEQLSACMWELMKEEWPGLIYHRSYDALREKWFIASEFRTLIGSGNGVYNSSVAFQESGSDTVVEVRSLKTISGGFQVPPTSVFEFAEKCQQSLSPK